MIAARLFEASACASEDDLECFLACELVVMYSRAA